MLQVHCKICKRNGGTEDSLVQRFQTGNMFTHHQKSVILDAAGLEGGPRLETNKLDRSKLQLATSCVVDTVQYPQAETPKMFLKPFTHSCIHQLVQLCMTNMP